MLMVGSLPTAAWVKRASGNFSARQSCLSLLIHMRGLLDASHRNSEPTTTSGCLSSCELQPSKAWVTWSLFRKSNRTHCYSNSRKQHCTVEHQTSTSISADSFNWKSITLKMIACIQCFFKCIGDKWHHI